MPDLYAALLHARLTLDGAPTPLEFTRAEVEQFYAPLAGRVLALAEGTLQYRARPDLRARAGVRDGAARPGRRTVAAVAGPPGSGKSAFTALLAAAANALAGAPLAVCVGMDGWHWPNVYLESHSVEREGNPVTLRRIKGAPETFNLPALAAFLNAARSQPELRFPVYSRLTHDPIPDAGSLSPAQQVLLLEGNYLLLDEPGWRELHPLFDLRIFLRAAPENLLEGLRQRHLRGGKDPAFAERHTRAVDLPNIQRVLDHSIPAEIVVEKRTGREIEAVHFFKMQG